MFFYPSAPYFEYVLILETVFIGDFVPAFRSKMQRLIPPRNKENEEDGKKREEKKKMMKQASKREAKKGKRERDVSRRITTTSR